MATSTSNHTPHPSMRSEPAPKKSEWTIGPDPDTDAPPEDDETLLSLD